MVDDCGIGVRRFRALRADAGELELDPLLYMLFIRRTILSGSNYQLARCFSDIHKASYGNKFLASQVWTDSTL